MSYHIEQINCNKESYLELLLIADPSEETVRSYLSAGDLYVMKKRRRGRMCRPDDSGGRSGRTQKPSHASFSPQTRTCYPDDEIPDGAIQPPEDLLRNRWYRDRRSRILSAHFLQENGISGNGCDPELFYRELSGTYL